VRKKPMNCPICNTISKHEGITLGGYAIECCTQCGLRFAPDAFEVETDYDCVYESDEYIKAQVDPIANEEYRHKFAEIGTYRPFFEHVEYLPGYTLLDVGCGVGRFLHSAHLKGWQVEGIDFSKKAIETGRRWAKFPMNIESLCDVEQSGKRYNVVTLFEVLEHLSDPVLMLKKCKNVIEPNGSIFFTVPNWECTDVQKSTNPAWIPPIHLLFFNESSLITLADVAGLDIIKTGFIGEKTFPKEYPLWLTNASKWIYKQIQRKDNHPLGIWMHARIAR
jgi:2-polyprenyl-3-methyl-5-hydroxy-6-metoxy-1,4-benzoquinol methylase